MNANFSSGGPLVCQWSEWLSRHLAVWRRPGNAVVWAAMVATGCSSGPTAVTAPSIDAEDSGERAVEMYDKDGDGFIAGAELDGSPALKSAVSRIDADGDGKLTADEIAARIETWQATKIGLTTMSCGVTLDGRPLDQGKITLEIEEFLGVDVPAATGEILAGQASATIPKDQRPSPDTPPGVPMGFYKVRITSEGGKPIPARYNANTTLGIEVALDNPSFLSHNIKFELESK